MAVLYGRCLGCRFRISGECAKDVVRLVDDNCPSYLPRRPITLRNLLKRAEAVGSSLVIYIHRPGIHVLGYLFYAIVEETIDITFTVIDDAQKPIAGYPVVWGQNVYTTNKRGEIKVLLSDMGDWDWSLEPVYGEQMRSMYEGAAPGWEVDIEEARHLWLYR